MTKGRNIIIFVNSQPLFDVHRQFLQTFLIDLQAEVSRFLCRIFTVFLFSQNLARLSSVFIFYKLSSGDCLAFRVILKQPFRIRFPDILKTYFYGQTFSGSEFFCTVMGKFFSRFLLLSIYQSTSEGTKPCFRKKKRHESTTLK